MNALQLTIERIDKRHQEEMERVEIMLRDLGCDEQELQVMLDLQARWFEQSKVEEIAATRRLLLGEVH